MAQSRERSASRGPKPARMLRIEYKGQPYDWFNLDEMGDIVRTSDFSNTLRENIAHYFGVPFDCQAVYDEEGMLSSVADFTRALHSTRPWLRVFDIREMDGELKERTVQQLNEITVEVERSLRHLGAMPQHRMGLVESAHDAGRVASQPSDVQSWPSPMTQRDSPVSLADAVRSANEERAMSASHPYGSQREGMGFSTGGIVSNSIGSTGPSAGLYSMGPTQNGTSHPQTIGAGVLGAGAPAPASFSSAPLATWTGPALLGQPNGAFMNPFGSTSTSSAPWVAPPTLNLPMMGSAGSTGNIYGMASVSSAYPGSPVAQLGQPTLTSKLGQATPPAGMPQQPLLAPLGTSGALPSAPGHAALGSTVSGPLLRPATPPPGSGSPPLSALLAGSAPAASAAWPGGPLNGMASAALGSASRSASPAALAGTARPTAALTSNGGLSTPSTSSLAVQAPVEVEVKSVGRNMHVLGSAGKPLMRQLDVLLPEHRPQKAHDPHAAGSAMGAAGAPGTSAVRDPEEAYDVIEVTISKDTSAGGERAQRFGFANVPTRDARALLISWVDQHGLLARWNRTFPEKAVSEGDRIVIVNNASDDVEAMRAELQTDTIHMLVHRRSSTAC